MLHISGAVCLIFYSVIGIVFIYKWWDVISLLEIKINFLFQQENERSLKSIGKTPKYHPNAPDTIIMVDEEIRKRLTKKRVTENTTTTETRND